MPRLSEIACVKKESPGPVRIGQPHAALRTVGRHRGDSLPNALNPRPLRHGAQSERARRPTAPSTSRTQKLPKSRGCQWRALARRLWRSKTIDSLETSERRGFHEVDGAPCRTCAADGVELGAGRLRRLSASAKRQCARRQPYGRSHHPCRFAADRRAAPCLRADLPRETRRRLPSQSPPAFRGEGWR